ncbi:MAG: aspartate carbamoyltransferase regulatory subunit [Firmicutes bacterium]|nr:aspartate carbamoyltransferase regulatory subunit [Bacillota bacterium]
MNIEPIVNGVVIDHITAGQGMRLYELLGLDKLDCSVAVIKNAMGKRGLRKDIIKIDQEIDLDLDVIGYADPGVTVNFIKEGKVAEKRTIEMPEKLVDVIKCRNPRCITGTEQELRHIFILTDRKNKVYRCMYCETQA